MKYLRTYNESINNQSNESYIDLMYILQSDLFDDYDIVAKTDETFEMGIDEPGYPDHKFWSFRHISGNEDTSNVNTDKDIKSIIVYNISDKEKDSFLDSLTGIFILRSNAVFSKFV